MMGKLAAALTALVAFASEGQAEAPHFAPWLVDGAVLQRGTDVEVSGTARAGDSVRVTLGKATQAVVAGRDGTWQADFGELGAAEGLQLTAVAGGDSASVHDVAIGDVFLCSGQSNMQFSLAQSALADEQRRKPIDAAIRLFTVPRVRSQVERANFGGPVSWTRADATGAGFSAVCLLTARELAQKREVPLGLVESDWGGTPIEGWLPREGLARAGAAPDVLAMLDAYARDPVAAGERYDAQVEADWKIAYASATQVRHPRAAYASLFDGMIAPLAGMRFAAAIWYQGENNAGKGDTRAQYVARLTALLTTWRARFRQADLPFVIVQIAPFGPISGDPVDDPWAEVREAQRRVVLADPHAALVTTIDVGERLYIHPPLKWPVAKRVAAAIEHLVYGGDVDLLGPLPEQAVRSGDDVMVRIEHATGGLVASSWGRPGPFQLCRSNGACTFADARFEGGAIGVTIPSGLEPATVRYCWGAAPICNVFDRASRPLGPFELAIDPQPASQVRQ